MQRRLATVVLWVAGLQLLVFGVIATMDPAMLLAPLGFAFARAEALIEARSFYGGAELGLGIAFCWAAMRSQWQIFALVAVACLFLSIAGVRAASMLMQSTQSTFLLVALIVEVLTGFAALFAYRKLAISQSQSQLAEKPLM
jgi:Domain of unknown function (DUF4345)